MMYLFFLIGIISGYMIGRRSYKIVEVKDSYDNPNSLKGKRLETACAVKLANEIVQSGALNIEKEEDIYLLSLKLIK
jgi:hypothetical protein